MRRDATDASVQRRADEEKKGTKGKNREKQERKPERRLQSRQTEPSRIPTSPRPSPLVPIC